MEMFGDPTFDKELDAILDHYPLEIILENLEISNKEVLKLLIANGYDVLSVYEEIVNG